MQLIRMMFIIIFALILNVMVSSSVRSLWKVFELDFQLFISFKYVIGFSCLPVLFTPVIVLFKKKYLLLFPLFIFCLVINFSIVVQTQNSFTIIYCIFASSLGFLNYYICAKYIEKSIEQKNNQKEYQTNTLRKKFGRKEPLIKP